MLREKPVVVVLAVELRARELSLPRRAAGGRCAEAERREPKPEGGAQRTETKIRVAPRARPVAAAEPTSNLAK